MSGDLFRKEKKDSLFKEVLLDCKFLVTDFWTSWVYPAYKFKNLLYKRFDLVRLPLKKTEYCDIVERMFLANMELIKDFIEKEKPEKYVYWYKSEKGDDVGPRYGQSYGQYTILPILYPELKNEYIMDIIKKIYNWYTRDRLILESDINYLSSLYLHYMSDTWFEPLTEFPSYEDNYYSITHTETDLTLEQANKYKFNWDIILKYFNKSNDALIAKNMHKKYEELELQLEKEKQYYLHLAIEVRNYLWT